MVLPSSTRVRRFVPPAANRNPAASVVLPQCPWPIRATFRTSFPSYTFKAFLLQVGYPEGILSQLQAGYVYVGQVGNLPPIENRLSLESFNRDGPMVNRSQ